MRLAAIVAVALTLSQPGEALATPKPKKATRAAAAPRPKVPPVVPAPPRRDAPGDDAERVLESAEATDKPSVEVVSGPPRVAGAIGPIALDPERAKPPPLTATASRGAQQPGGATRPSTMWPVYTAGVMGLGGLAAAVIFGSLSLDASHAIDVADGALVRAGVTRARCAQPTANTPFEATCSTIRRNEGIVRSFEGTAPVALAIGITGVAFAIGWYVLAPKEPRARDRGESARDASVTPRVSPWVTASSGGAAIEGRF